MCFISIVIYYGHRASCVSLWMCHTYISSAQSKWHCSPHTSLASDYYSTNYRGGGQTQNVTWLQVPLNEGQTGTYTFIYLFAKFHQLALTNLIWNVTFCAHDPPAPSLQSCCKMRQQRTIYKKVKFENVWPKNKFTELCPIFPFSCVYRESYPPWQQYLHLCLQYRPWSQHSGGHHHWLS